MQNRSMLMQAPITQKIIGTFFDVYNELGPGFLESVYGSAMVIALEEAGLHVVREAFVPVSFRGRVIGEFRADLIIESRVLIELKACRAIEPSHEAQLLHYLRATPIEVGLLLDFGPKPEFKRAAFGNSRKYPRESAQSAAALACGGTA